MSFESQLATHFQIAQLTYLIRMSSTIDFTMKKSQKDKMVREDGLDKLVVLEQMMMAFEGTSLHDHIKTTEMCLVSNMIILINFIVHEFVRCTGTQCIVTHLKAYYNKMIEVVYEEKLLINFFQDN
jgi:hypothetical protein